MRGGWGGPSSPSPSPPPQKKSKLGPRVRSRGPGVMAALVIVIVIIYYCCNLYSVSLELQILNWTSFIRWFLRDLCARVKFLIGQYVETSRTHYLIGYQLETYNRLLDNIVTDSWIKKIFWKFKTVNIWIRLDLSAGWNCISRVQLCMVIYDQMDSSLVKCYQMVSYMILTVEQIISGEEKKSDLTGPRCKQMSWRYQPTFYSAHRL